MCLFLFYFLGSIHSPRHLQKYASKGLLVIRNILQFVTKLLQLLLGHLKWLCNLILTECRILKLSNGLVPESIHYRGIGKPATRLRKTLGIHNDMRPTRLLGTLQRCSHGFKDHLLILLTSLLEALGKLGITLLALLLGLLDHHRLRLAQLTRRDDLGQRLRHFEGCRCLERERVHLELGRGGVQFF